MATMDENAFMLRAGLTRVAMRLKPHLRMRREFRPRTAGPNNRINIH
jgi:hypothetical protein